MTFTAIFFIPTPCWQVMYVMPSSSARCSQLPRAVDKLPFYIALRKLRDHLRGDIQKLDDSEVVFVDIELKSEPVRFKTAVRVIADDIRAKVKDETVEPRNLIKGKFGSNVRAKGKEGRCIARAKVKEDTDDARVELSEESDVTSKVKRDFDATSAKVCEENDVNKDTDDTNVGVLVNEDSDDVKLNASKDIVVIFKHHLEPEEAHNASHTQREQKDRFKHGTMHHKQEQSYYYSLITY